MDVSSNEIGQMGGNGSCKCTTLQYLGFEIFEIIMLTLLGIAVIYMGFRMMTEGKTSFKKWKEARKIAKERKFEKMRMMLLPARGEPAKSMLKPKGSQNGNLI